MATSPRKSPASKKSIASGSTKPRKSVKTSIKSKSNDETADESIQEMEKQTKPKKSTSQGSIRVVDSSKKQTQGTALATTFRTFIGAYHTIFSRNGREESFEKTREQTQGEYR